MTAGSSVTDIVSLPKTLYLIFHLLKVFTCRASSPASRGKTLNVSGGSQGIGGSENSRSKRASTRTRSSAACWSMRTNKGVLVVVVPDILIRMNLESTCAITCAVQRAAFVSLVPWGVKVVAVWGIGWSVGLKTGFSQF